MHQTSSPLGKSPSSKTLISRPRPLIGGQGTASQPHAGPLGRPIGHEGKTDERNILCKEDEQGVRACLCTVNPSFPGRFPLQSSFSIPDAYKRRLRPILNTQKQSKSRLSVSDHERVCDSYPFCLAAGSVLLALSHKFGSQVRIDLGGPSFDTLRIGRLARPGSYRNTSNPHPQLSFNVKTSANPSGFKSPFHPLPLNPRPSA